MSRAKDNVVDRDLVERSCFHKSYNELILGASCAYNES